MSHALDILTTDFLPRGAPVPSVPLPFAHPTSSQIMEPKYSINLDGEMGKTLEAVLMLLYGRQHEAEAVASLVRENKDLKDEVQGLRQKTKTLEDQEALFTHEVAELRILAKQKEVLEALNAGFAEQIQLLNAEIKGLKEHPFIFYPDGPGLGLIRASLNCYDKLRGKAGPSGAIAPRSTQKVRSGPAGKTGRSGPAGKTERSRAKKPKVIQVAQYESLTASASSSSSTDSSSSSD